MLEMKSRPSGGYTVKVCCCWCERKCQRPDGWQVVFDGIGEPIICCGRECAQAVRADDPVRDWTSIALTQFLLDLVSQFASERRSWRCSACRHRDRQAIDLALLEHTMSQRAVAEQYGLSKTTVAQHSLGHLSLAVLAARSRATA